MPSKQELGERIKRFRLERNLTLKEVELKAKVSATHVSEIERGMTSPTVGALTRIARALGTEPAYFLRNSAYGAVSVVRGQKRRTFRFDGWGARISCLTEGIRGACVSFLEVEIEPGRSEEVETVSHEGEAHVHILKGVVEIHVGDERHLLKEGDSVHFSSKQPYSVRNIGDGVARFVWTITPPFAL